MTERRASTRTPFAGRVYVTIDGRCRAERVRDLSAGGLGLESTQRLRPGRNVTLFLPLQRGDGWVMCLLKGRIAGRDRSGRLGVALVPGAKDARALLRAHLSD